MNYYKFLFLLMVLLMQFCLVFGNAHTTSYTSVSEEPVCEALTNKFKEKSVLTKKDRKTYCEYSCGKKFSCVNDDDKVNLGFETVNTYFSLLASPNVTEQQILSLDFDFSDDYFEYTYDLFMWMLPISIGLFAVGMIRWLQIKDKLSLLILVIFVGLLSKPFTHSNAIIFFNAVCIVLVMFIGDRSPIPYDVIGVMAGFVLFLLASLLLNPQLQLFLIVIMLVAFFAFLRFVFIEKRNVSNIAAILLIAIVAVLIDMVDFIITHMPTQSPAFTVLGAMLYSLVPFGKGHSFLINTSSYIIQFLSFYDWSQADKLYYAVVMFFMEVIMFGVFRGFIGCSFIMSLKFEFSTDLLVKGLFLYMVNIWSPIKLTLLILTGNSPINSKNMFCSFGMLLLMIMEGFYAFDFFLLRLCFTAIGCLFNVNAHLILIPNLLSHNIDLNQMAFPCEDSNVFLSLTDLCDVGKCVIRATGKSLSGKNFPLVGTIRNAYGNKVSIFTTIGHNLSNIQGVNIFDRFYPIDDLKSRMLSTEDDPIVDVELDDKYDIGKPFSLISPDETEFIDHLFVIIPNDDDKSSPMITSVPNWKIRNGKLLVSVNLRVGDSGSPIFAVLKKTGSIRFCGAVSCGTSSIGSPNVFSLVNIRDPDGTHSSDEEDNPVFRFNKNRSTNKCGRMRELIDNRNVIFKDWEQSLMSRFLAEKDDNKDKVQDFDPYNLPDYDGIDSPGYKFKSKHDMKRRNKDRAFIKRRLNINEEFKRFINENDLFKDNPKYRDQIIDDFCNGFEITMNNSNIFESTDKGVIDERMINLLDELNFHYKVN